MSDIDKLDKREEIHFENLDEMLSVFPDSIDVSGLV